MSFQAFAAALTVICVLVLIAAALHDVAFRTVPNWMCLSLAAMAAMLRVVQGNLAASIGIALAVLLGAAWCWRHFWLGGADVKLMAASILLVPPALAFTLLLQITLAGGALALLYLLASHVVARPASARPAGFLPRIWRAERYRMSRRGPLPYASAIAAGSLLMLAGS